jgi:hypothetical protein
MRAAKVRLDLVLERPELAKLEEKKAKVWQDNK